MNKLMNQGNEIPLDFNDVVKHLTSTESGRMHYELAVTKAINEKITEERNSLREQVQSLLDADERRG